jgi:hypothetical protein
MPKLMQHVFRETRASAEIQKTGLALAARRLCRAFNRPLLR